MILHLDTNVMIALLNGRPAAVRARLDAAVAGGAALAMSSIVLHELAFGVAASARVEDNERKLALLLSQARIDVVAFDEAAAFRAGRLRAAGAPIGPYDVLIAGHALAAGATLVTANVGEFARCNGLATIDWSR